jgi:four helix bundle protein
MDSYRSLGAWKLANEAAYQTAKACDAACRAYSRDLLNQLKRAAVSVEANIVEGYALGTPGLVGRHLRIAFGSAAEAECQARLAGRLEYLEPEIVTLLERLFGDTMRALRGLLRSPKSLSTTHGSHAQRTTHNAHSA